MPSDNYDLLAARLLSLLDGDILPLPKWGDLERNEQRIAIAVQDVTGMTPEHWAKMDRHSREPWLERTIAVVASHQEANAGDDPADVGENTSTSQCTEQPHTYTLGALVRDLAASESAYTANMKTGERVRSQQGSLVAHSWDVQAAVMRWRPDASRMPGIDRIELICDSRFGSGVTVEAIRRLRSELCQRHGLSLEDSNNLTLTQAADLLESPSGSQVTELQPSADVLERLHRTFLELQEMTNPQERGYAFEQFLNDLFTAYGLDPRGSFRMMGEQIDGTFEWQGDVFLVEARWRSEPANASDLFVLRSKVEGKSDWTRGLFISINDFTEIGVKTFSVGRRANLITVSGHDLTLILERHWSLPDALRVKLRHAGETSSVYLPLVQAQR